MDPLPDGIQRGAEAGIDVRPGLDSIHQSLVNRLKMLAKVEVAFGGALLVLTATIDGL
jgi:hypothetical protein